MPEPTVNVLIGSGGRRNYMVRWFRDALRHLGVEGRLVVVDANQFAPALADADDGVVVPRLSDRRYGATIVELCRSNSIDLAFSLNDFEIATWADQLANPLDELGVTVVGAPTQTQGRLEDKRHYSEFCSEFGIDTPRTLTGKEALAMPEEVRGWGNEIFVKHRFGSGSVGLTLSRQDQLSRDLPRLAEGARTRDGRVVDSLDEGLEHLVVQERLDGQEFGVDVVNDLDAQFRGLLARRKLSMRGGETDQAVTVEAEPFEEMARGVSMAIRHTGLIDTDWISDGDRRWLIDINPRFGGGYPFSHLAGADVPACYLSWHLNRAHDPTWLSTTAGVVSSKYEGICATRDYTGA